jgi:pectate lyase
MSEQQSGKRGKQSTAQKRDSSRHGFGPIPATSKVAGATGGNQPTGRTAQDVNERYVEENMRERAGKSANADEPTTAENVFNPVIETLPEKSGQ